MIDSNYKFYLLLLSSILLVTIPAIYTFWDDVKKKRKEKLTDPTIDFKKERSTLFCALLGAVIFFYNSCDSHNQSLKSEAKAIQNDRLAKQSESNYRELLNKKIDTAKYLSKENISITDSAKRIITVTKDLVSASQNLISNVDYRTQQGLSNIKEYVSKSPQQRILDAYNVELSASSQLLSVIATYTNFHSEFFGDSLKALEAFDSILQRMQNVYPNYMFKIDDRISELWKRSIQSLSSAPSLIKMGFGDYSDPNPVSERRQTAQRLSDGLYEYTDEASINFINISSYIEEHLRKDKPVGGVRGMYDFSSPNYVPEDSIYHP